MGKKKRKGGGGEGGGGGGAGGPAGGGGGDNNGQGADGSLSSPAPDQQAAVSCNNNDDGGGDSKSTDQHAQSGAADDQRGNNNGKGTGKEGGGGGGGKEQGGGGAFVTAVLKVDFHCDGCADKIQRSIRGFKGVEGLKLDRNANRVTVVGTMDPWKLQDRIQKKTRKKVEVISPAKKKQGGGGGEKQNPSDNKSGNKQEVKHNHGNPEDANKGTGDGKEDEKKGGDKQQEQKPGNPKEDGKKGDSKQVQLAVSTVAFKVQLHCDGCIRRIRAVLMKIKGVEQVAIDTQKNQVTVKGTMKTKGLVEFLSKKIQRRVEVVVGQKEKDNKEKEKERSEKEERKEKEKSCPGLMTCHSDMGWCHCDKCGYHVYMVPAPQLFSDENPNACAVM